MSGTISLTDPLNRRSKLVWTTVALLFMTACSQHHDDNRPTPQAKQEQPAPAPSRPAEARTPPPQAPPASVQRAPDQTQVNNPAAVAVAPTPAADSSEPKKLGERVAQGLVDAKAKAGDLAKTAGDAANSLVNTPPDQAQREDALAKIAADNRATHKGDVAAQEADVQTSAPLGAKGLEKVLQFNDDVTGLLATYLTETDPDRLSGDGQMLADEIFSEPDQVRGKVMETQLNLRRLSQNNLYARSQQQRVSYLQAMIDERLNHDEFSHKVREGFAIAASSLALGTVAGFHGFDKVRDGVDGFEGIGPNLRKIKDGVSDGVGSVYGGTKRRVSAVFGGDGWIRNRIFGRRISFSEVGGRNLKALGLDDDAVKDLELGQVPRSYFSYLSFEDTNLPGFKYAVFDHWGQTALANDQRVVVFTLLRSPESYLRPIYIGTRPLARQDAENLVNRLKFKSPAEGGKDFAQVVEADGQVSPTRMETSALDEALSTPATTGVGTSVERQQVEADLADTAASPRFVEIQRPSPDGGEVMPTEPVQEAPTTVMTSAAEQHSILEGEITTDSPNNPVSRVERSPLSVAEAQADGHDLGLEVIQPNTVNTPSRLTMASRAAASAAGHVKDSLSSAAGRTVDGVSSAVGGAVSGVAAVSRGAATGIKDGTVAAVKAVRAGTGKVIGSIRPVWNNFDGKWAAVTTAGVAVPAYALYFRGYEKGKVYGAGQNTLYLESLIPKEQLANVAMDVPKGPNP
jgi:hypothetical protein